MHIIGRNKIDSLWLNTGPKEELLSICNCCPCCCLWRMAPELPDDLGKGFSSMIGVQIIFKSGSLQCCGLCASGICFVCNNCEWPQKAQTVKITDDSVKISIERVDPLVDLNCQ